MNTCSLVRRGGLPTKRPTRNTQFPTPTVNLEWFPGSWRLVVGSCERYHAISDGPMLGQSSSIRRRYRLCCTAQHGQSNQSSDLEQGRSDVAREEAGQYAARVRHRATGPQGRGRERSGGPGPGSRRREGRGRPWGQGRGSSQDEGGAKPLVRQVSAAGTAGAAGATTACGEPRVAATGRLRDPDHSG